MSSRLPGNGEPQTKRVILHSRNLKEIPITKKIESATELYLDKNPITSLANLPSIPCLQVLSLSHTKIESFKGAKEQPSLTSLIMLNSPLGADQFFRVMALIVYGNQVNKINNAKIPSESLKLADHLRPHIKDLLLAGWTITSVSPVKLINRETRERKVIHVPTVKPTNTLSSPSSSGAVTPKKPASSSQSVSETPLLAMPTFDDLEIGDNNAALDALLETLVKLSKEWNRGPALEEENTDKRNKDDLYKSATIAAQSASVVRYRRALRTKEGPKEVPTSLKSISVRREPPVTGRQKYPWLMKRVEEEQKKKEDAEQRRKEEQVKSVERKQKQKFPEVTNADFEEPTFSLLDQLYARRFYKVTESSGRERLRLQERSKTSAHLEAPPEEPGSQVPTPVKPRIVASPSGRSPSPDLKKTYSQSVFHLVDTREMLGYPLDIEE